MIVKLLDRELYNYHVVERLLNSSCYMKYYT